MGQAQSTPKPSATEQSSHQNHATHSPTPFHEEQLAELRGQLARLADALTLVQSSDSMPPQQSHNASPASTTASSHASTLSGPTENPSSVAHHRLSSSAATAAFLLQPFTEVHLAGYQFGDDVLTTPLTLTTEEQQQQQDQLLNPLSVTPAASPLSYLGRNTALAVLDLSYNALTVSVVAPLLQAISGLPALTVLRLSGNPLGTASKGKISDNATEEAEKRAKDVPHLVPYDTLEGANENSKVGAQTAAAQLGRWLATNPPLQELALFQCNFNDDDVHALLRGLVPSTSHDVLSPSALTTLQLAGNAACTWRSAQLVLQLLTSASGRNETLRVVELEGAPPATAVRLEYACTPAGYFRSGKTLVPAVDAASSGEGAAEKENEGEDNLKDAASATLTADQWRSLTPGQSARFRGRRRHLRNDLDGTQVLLPALMERIHDVLAARRSAAAAAAATPAATVVNSFTGLLQAADSARYAEEDEEAMQAMKEVAQRESSFTQLSTKGGEDSVIAAVVEEGSDGERDAHGESTVEERETAQSGTASPHESSRHPSRTSRTATADPQQQPSHLLLHSASAPRSSPQERRAAKFETPARLAAVMADARAYRRHLHPMQVDTHAPPCAEVHARSTSSRYGTAAQASTWYAHEGFVLRSNGMSRVLVAPVVAGAAAIGAQPCNVLLEEVEDRPLKACWCTPRNTSNAATYAGTLHYHCVREGDPVQHKGGGATTTTSAAAAAAAARARRVRRQQQQQIEQQQQQQLLPPLAGLADTAEPAAGRSAGRAYLACSGTGHACLSAAVATHGPLRAQRLRTTLRTQSTTRRVAAASQEAYGTQHEDGGRPRTSLPMRQAAATGRISSAPPLTSSTSSTSSSQGGGGFGPATTMFGGAKTVHTTSSGLSVALNYNPVTFFGGPHVACASGIQVEECT